MLSYGRSLSAPGNLIAVSRIRMRVGGLYDISSDCFRAAEAAKRNG